MSRFDKLLNFDTEYDYKKTEDRKPILQDFLNSLEDQLNDFRFKILKEYLVEYGFTDMKEENNDT